MCACDGWRRRRPGEARLRRGGVVLLLLGLGTGPVHTGISDAGSTLVLFSSGAARAASTFACLRSTSTILQHAELLCFPPVVGYFRGRVAGWGEGCTGLLLVVVVVVVISMSQDLFLGTLGWMQCIACFLCLPHAVGGSPSGAFRTCTWRQFLRWWRMLLVQFSVW